jgi:hypothetical protein
VNVLASFLRTQAAALLAAADEIDRGEQASTPEYFSETNMPPGETSWPALLRRGRAGAFELVRLGRRVVIPRQAYEAWRATKTSRRAAGVSEDRRARLERLGLKVVA